MAHISIIVAFLLTFAYSQELCEDVENHPKLHLIGSTTDCGFADQGVKLRIREGTTVPSGQMPWMVRLYSVTGNTGSECGGTLINKRYVLTAAHCTLRAQKVHVYVPRGDYNLEACPLHLRMSTKCQPKFYTGAKVIKHHGYDPKTYYNDVALIRLDKDVELDNFVRPICLPSSCSLQYLSPTLTAAGWGVLYGTPDKPETFRDTSQLQKADLEIEFCPSTYFFNGQHVETLPSQVCATDPISNKGICSGDSGGPLMAFFDIGGSTRFVQIGISSIGPSCINDNQHNFSTFFSRVNLTMPWVLDNMEP